MAWSLLMKRSHSRLSKLPWHSRSYSRFQFRLSHTLSTPISTRRKETLGALGAVTQNIYRPVRGIQSNLYPKTFLIPTRYFSGNKGTPNITTSINTAAANIAGRPELVKDLEKAEEIIPLTKSTASNVINPLLMQVDDEELVYFQPSQGSYIDSTTFESITQPTIYQLNKVEGADYAFTLRRPDIPLDLAVQADGNVSFQLTGNKFKIVQTSTSDNLYKFTISFLGGVDDDEELFLYMDVDDSVDPPTSTLRGTTTIDGNEQATEFILRRAESPKYSVLTYALDFEGQSAAEKSSDTVLVDRQYIGTLTDGSTDAPLIYTCDVVTPWTFTPTEGTTVDNIFTIYPLLRVNPRSGEIFQSNLLRDAQIWSNEEITDTDLNATKLRTRIETIITNKFENNQKSFFNLRMYYRNVSIPMAATVFNENTGDQIEITGDWSGRVYFDPQVTDDILRLNCGGGDYTDTSGIFWGDDTNFVTDGDVDHTYTTTGTIENVDDSQIYLSERWSNQNLTYTIPVSNGNYTLRLYFAEIYFDMSGERQFNIQVQGFSVNSVDIYGEVGSFKALVQEWRNVIVSDGELTITLEKDVQNPKISAIAIERVQDTNNSDPPSSDIVEIDESNVNVVLTFQN